MIYAADLNGNTFHQAILNLQDNLFQGFLKKDDLLSFFDPNNNCVGIRIYNAYESSNDLSPRVIAVGVRENGTEIAPSNNYLLSKAFTLGTLPANAEGKTIGEATECITLALNNLPNNDPRESLKFSSFFSKVDIDNLLAEKSLDNQSNVDVQGIGFFVVDHDVSFKTHIAAAYANVPSLNRLPDTILQSHILSDMHCPGACATLNTDVNQTVTPDAQTFESTVGDSTGIYLVRWQ